MNQVTPIKVRAHMGEVVITQAETAEIYVNPEQVELLIKHIKEAAEELRIQMPRKTSL